MARSSRKLLARRDAAIASIEALAKLATTEDRELTPEEVQKRDRFERTARKLEKRAVTARVDERVAKREKAAEARTDLGTDSAPTNSKGGAVKVTGSERVYREGGPYHYLTDLTQKALGNSDAAERLARHAKEVAVEASEAEARIRSGSARPFDRYFVRQVRAGMGASGAGPYEAQFRALSTAAGSGGEFVPPAYLTAKFVPFARPGRPFADSCTSEELPPGTMSINIPKVYGGTAVETQGTGNPRSQNVGVQDTDLETEYVTFPVVTVAGQQVLSLQLLERSPVPFDDVTFRDLTLALAQKVDFKCIAGPGAGDVLGALNTPNVVSVEWDAVEEGDAGVIPDLLGALSGAKAAVASQRFLPATHVFFTPDRWEWVEQQTDKNGRPLIVPTTNGPFNVAQVAPEAGIAEGETGGRIQGLRSFQDFNIPANLGEGANQDAIVVAKMDDLYLYESPIVARALPQTLGQQLSVVLQVYEYMAYTAARYPVSVAYVTGTYLTNPVAFTGVTVTP
jgi:HK97 family phage major capsid protein